ncbi:hypothetical protein [Tetragenococcus halophilus]|uniref:Uncharacterized protein n=1 Tax=Tetragenococcus halophilus TaxID=51669 RepID=A0AB35HLW7_TETHA|nr:hypothetical protein [Tetragenococcus halophilus]MCO8297245.1 hypothetical protein [Tetragenococcus halophilus]
MRERKAGVEMSKTLKISNAYLRIDKDDEFTIVIPDGTRKVEYEFIAKRELLDLMEFDVEEVEE